MNQPHDNPIPKSDGPQGFESLPPEQDAMLDAFLSEAFGAATPPDLTDQILATFQQRRQSAGHETPAEVSPAIPTPVTTTPAIPTPVRPMGAMEACSPENCGVDGDTASGPPAPVSIGANVAGEVSRGATPSGSVPMAQPAEQNGHAPREAAAAERGRGRRRPAGWTLGFLVGGAVAAAVVVAVLGLIALRGTDSQLADQNRPEDGGNLQNNDGQPGASDLAAGTDSAISPAENAGLDNSKPEDGSQPPRDGAAVVQAPGSDGRMPGRKSPAVDDPSQPDSTRIANNPASQGVRPKVEGANPPSDSRDERRRRIVTLSEPDILASANAMIRALWDESGVTPAPPAADAKWCRRVYLDVIGRIPTAEETLAYLEDDSPDKKSKLVDALLNSDSYLDQYVHNWTGIWTGLLIGRSDDNNLVSRAGLQQYLRRALADGKPYDRLVHELISAQGSNTPGAENFNGAVNFVLDNLEEEATPATAKVSRLFLGMQLQCAQCHNHPFNDWKQSHFWELNAFFRQAKPLRQYEGGRLQSVQLVDEDFRGEGNDPASAEIYYERLNGLLCVSYPRFITGEPIDPSGFVQDVNRRQELADFVVGSEQFSQAVVNRMWAHFLGHGFTQTLDEMGPHVTRSHPELLSMLSDQFVGHGHDLRQLIRWITLSQPYGLSSESAGVDDDPATGSSPLFARFYLRQMRADEVYESLLVACEASTGEKSLQQRQQDKSEWLAQFAIAYDTDENDEASTFNGSVAQSLSMWNGPLMQQATSAQQSKLLQRLGKSNLKERQKVSYLYLATLGRQPSKPEMQVALRALASSGGKQQRVLEDIMWALLNGGEFIINH